MKQPKKVPGVRGKITPPDRNKEREKFLTEIRDKFKQKGLINRRKPEITGGPVVDAQLQELEPPAKEVLKFWWHKSITQIQYGDALPYSNSE